jgi:hypothetical protein
MKILSFIVITLHFAVVLESHARQYEPHSNTLPSEQAMQQIEKPYSNTLPSEQTIQQMKNLAAPPQTRDWWDDGPPGSGTGGGGAVGAPVGSTSVLQLVAVVAIYSIYSFRRKKKVSEEK